MKHSNKNILKQSIEGVVAIFLGLGIVVYIVLFSIFWSIWLVGKKVTGKDEFESDLLSRGIIRPFIILGDIADKIEELKDKVLKLFNH